MVVKSGWVERGQLIGYAEGSVLKGQDTYISHLHYKVRNVSKDAVIEPSLSTWGLLYDPGTGKLK